MIKREINIMLLSGLLLLGAFLWYVPAPVGLQTNAWHVFITFFITILGIITSAMPMGAVTFAAILVLVLTHTLTLKEALSGFGSPIAWLVVIAFFIARGFIKTNLGKRVAYYLISKFGHTSIGLSYSLIFTEFFLAPMIPSTSARGGGIIYPIAKSLADTYDAAAGGKSRTSAFIINTCFHANVICCALFLTSMAGNPLIASLAQSAGVTITWTTWAMAAIVPGVLNLLLLPMVNAFLLKPDKASNLEIVATAKEALRSMGRLSRQEIIMLGTFFLMLFLWIFGSTIGMDATTAAILGFLILVVTEVITWSDVTGERTAWETLIWFATLLMLSEYLTKLGVDGWVEDHIRYMIGEFTGGWVFIGLCIAYFYSHYLFASVTAHVTVMFLTFLLILIGIGIPLPVAGMSLAILSNLSASLTHYGIATAPIYFSAGYFTTRQWLQNGIVIASFNLLLWASVGGLWWKTLGWW